MCKEASAGSEGEKSLSSLMDECLHVFSGDHGDFSGFFVSVLIRFSKEFMIPSNCLKEGKCKRSCTSLGLEKNLQTRLEGVVGGSHFPLHFWDTPVLKIRTYRRYYYFNRILKYIMLESKKVFKTKQK